MSTIIGGLGRVVRGGALLAASYFSHSRSTLFSMIPGPCFGAEAVPVPAHLSTKTAAGGRRRLGTSPEKLRPEVSRPARRAMRKSTWSAPVGMRPRGEQKPLMRALARSETSSLLKTVCLGDGGLRWSGRGMWRPARRRGEAQDHAMNYTVNAKVW